jgi:hypothetical protein
MRSLVKGLLKLPFIERAYWAIAKKLYHGKNVNGIDFVFVEAETGVSAQQIESTLAKALDVIANAKGGFGELVKSHLRLVSAIRVPHAYASQNSRAYVSAFRGHEATNSRYLACQLVWAATFIRLSRDALASTNAIDKASVRRAAYEAQLRFVRQFGDSEQWVEYLEHNKPE